MSDPREDQPQRAVRNGLLALAAVSVAVGLVLALVAFVGLQVLGFGGGDGGGESASGREVLSIPPIQETEGPSGPAITLFTPTPEEEPSASASKSKEKPTDEETTKQGEISLSAGQLEVNSFDRIDLTGVYPGGEGAVLQVQRFEGGSWQDFPTTTAVSNETFSTYIQTGVTGPNRFRMLDKADGVSSNEVKVRVKG